MRMLAWTQANLITTWMKKGKRCRVEDLLPSEHQRPQSLDEFNAMMEAKRKRLEARQEAGV